jgi:hypothetical protein
VTNWTVKQLKEVLENNKGLKVNPKYLKDIESIDEDDNLSDVKKKTFAGGRREDLDNVFFRSSWEANIARYFNFVGIKWTYEPKQFEFPVKRGCVSYKPDFYLPKEDTWVEVKGYMDSKSKTKLNRFKRYYPEEYKKLIIIGREEYKEISKHKAIIPYWEEASV